MTPGVLYCQWADYLCEILLLSVTCTTIIVASPVGACNQDDVIIKVRLFSRRISRLYLIGVTLKKSQVADFRSYTDPLYCCYLQNTMQGLYCTVVWRRRTCLYRLTSLTGRLVTA